MSSLLTLAKDLEQKSKAQQQHTGEMLKTVFREHEQSVKAELSASAKRISDAISAHEKGMSEAMQSNRLNVLRMVGRTWLTLTMVSVLLLASLSGVMWWQGQRIAANLSTLREQEDTLAKQNAKTWGVTYLEDRNGRFLVLPKGMTVDREKNWTIGSDRSKQNALRLVKE